MNKPLNGICQILGGLPLLTVRWYRIVILRLPYTGRISATTSKFAVCGTVGSLLTSCLKELAKMFGRLMSCPLRSHILTVAVNSRDSSINTLYVLMSTFFFPFSPQIKQHQIDRCTAHGVTRGVWLGPR